MPVQHWDNDGMSPKSRGRPPGRGRRRQPGKSAGRPSARHLSVVPDADETGEHGQKADCWFDEPAPGDRRSWAVPPAHGTYRGLDLELLDPGDEGALTLLIEARHPEWADALESGEEVIVDGEPVSPRLHVTLHQVVANQLLADDPPQTWQTVRRLAGLGYDWHNIMHMIASLVAEDVHGVLKEHRRHDPAAYARRLSKLPGDWPPPE